MDIIRKDLVKVEGNICEYPFFSFSKSEGKREKKVYKFSPITLEDGKIVKRKLTLESPKEWGLPSSFDMDVLIAISHIGTETNTLTERTYYTLYDIAKRLGLPNQESRIRDSILRMYYVNCHSEYCILVIDKKGKEKKYLTKQDYFHIFNNVSFLDTKTEKNRRKSRENTYVRFNEFFIQNFFSGYWQYIDFSKYLDLETPTAKRLYIYLSKKRFDRSTFKISIEKLANVIPIESKELFKIRQVLKEACEHLINQKVISGYQLEKGAMDITFYFPAQEIKGAETPLPLLESLDSKNNGVYAELIEAGVTQGVAKQLITKYPVDKIKRQIKWVKYREAKDPAAVLVSAIKDDWAPPKGFKEDVRKKEMQRETEDFMKKVENARYIIFPSGSKHKISRKFDDAIEYFIDEKEKCVVLFHQTLDCKFE